jgi:hypothetical protein
MKLFVLSVLFFVAVSGHDEYRGKCPDFKPMPGFDWDKVSAAELALQLSAY